MNFIQKVAAKYKIMAVYKIEDLDKEEYQTLLWLADHGYDGDIMELTTGEEKEEGGYRFDPIAEHLAWEIKENSEQHGFLTSNGSHSLADKLWKFINNIV